MRRYHTLFDGRLREHRTSGDALLHLELAITRSHAFCSGLAETAEGHVEIRQVLRDEVFSTQTEKRSGDVEAFHFPSEHELIHHMRHCFQQGDRPILGEASFPHVLASIRARFKTTRGVERAIVNHFFDGDPGLMEGFSHLAAADMETGYGDPQPRALKSRPASGRAANMRFQAPDGTFPQLCAPDAHVRCEGKMS